MKSEPDAYSIYTLKKELTTLWDGIRNYQARNFMRSMETGDKAFFYHSNCKIPAIVGLMEVIKTNVIDPTQFDKSSKYFDPKSIKSNPRWDCTEMKYLGLFSNNLSLQDLRESYTEDELPVTRKGNRLSITPVPKDTANDLLSKLGKLID